MEFRGFSKIPRLSREMIITEKIDGTNGIIAIDENGTFAIGSRKQWLCIVESDGEVKMSSDNFGFARWALANMLELRRLGVGYHYGEWWGNGIQRGYGLKEKRFSLFNVSRWSDPDIRPSCCHVVPTLYTGMFNTEVIELTLGNLKSFGSYAAPGYMKPEGIVVFHSAGGYLFKKTIEKDEFHKGEIAT